VFSRQKQGKAPVFHARVVSRFHSFSSPPTACRGNTSPPVLWLLSGHLFHKRLEHLLFFRDFSLTIENPGSSLFLWSLYI
jgi:hypothetical protein